MANADRIIELLHEAKTRPAGAERDHFLAEACRDDAALKEQIVSLLEAEANEGKSDFLKINQILRPAVLLTEKPGDRIGRYKLLEQIGEGGCGVVYMAEQEEPVRRRVALKVIKLGMDTKQVIARFEAERQALAMMDHPNIAKVLDGGATDTGRPFFVMELVRGIKITDYCDQNNLATNERLALFIQVCQAIQHAHQKGIIHRDIKPSNILVTQHDDVAVPKVIDFGIAKATVGQLTDKTVFTAFAQFIGTPAYMSPEQAQMSGLDVDTRADIYSLGVLLYELLTGHTPFDAKELLAAGMDEMRRKIREDEPAKPSTCLSTMLTMDLTTVAKRRHVEPPKLIHLIRGDLDWLVMKCLEKDRTRRYETANGLAVDLQRHLDNEPVIARPPSNLYRFQKLVRRNKLAFAATTAVTVALMFGLGLSTWLFLRERLAVKEAAENALRAEHSRELAEANEKKASAAAAKSQQVVEFMKGMLAGVVPWTAKGRDTTMLRAILDQTAKRLNSLKDQPTVEADLRAIFGDVYSDLGEYTNAVAMHHEAISIQKKQFGEVHREVADALSSLAWVHQKHRKWEEAEAVCREELAITKKLSGDEHPWVANSLARLAGLLHHAGKLAEAELFCREALAMRRKLLGKEHPDVAAALGTLAILLRDQGKLIEAEIASREVLAMRKKLFGEVHREIERALGCLAQVLQDQRKFSEAETVWREELAMERKLSGDVHLSVLNSQVELAQVLLDSGKSSEAEAVAREASKLQRKLVEQFGYDFYDNALLGNCLETLTSTLLATEKFIEAEPIARECLAVREVNPDDWTRYNTRSMLGGSLLGQKRYAEAEPLLLSSYEGMKQWESKIHGSQQTSSKRGLKETVERLTQLYQDTGQPDRAAEWSSKLAEIAQAEAGKDSANPKP